MPKLPKVVVSLRSDIYINGRYLAHKNQKSKNLLTYGAFFINLNRQDTLILGILDIL